MNMVSKIRIRRGPAGILSGLFAFTLLWSCAGNPGTAYRAPLDSLQTGARLEIRTLYGTDTVFLTSPYLGSGVKVQGSLGAAGDDGSRIISLESLTLFQNWAQGWTEGEWAVAGEVRLVPSDGKWTLEVREAPEILEVRTAALRYKDRMIRNDQAQKYLRDRWERVQAGAALVSGSWYPAPRGGWNWLPPGWTDQFEENAGRVLFPEVYGSADSPQSGGEKSDGEGLLWDKEYTLKTFPPVLHEIRNTGTLYRDWEEGLGLWFLAAQWKPFWEQKFPAAVFHLQ